MSFNENHVLLLCKTDFLSAKTALYSKFQVIFLFIKTALFAESTLQKVESGRDFLSGRDNVRENINRSVYEELATIKRSGFGVPCEKSVGGTENSAYMKRTALWQSFDLADKFAVDQINMKFSFSKIKSHSPLGKISAL